LKQKQRQKAWNIKLDTETGSLKETKTENLPFIFVLSSIGIKA
jgi:hypothetical protein